MNKIVFFDLETGGLDLKKHAIIQIAAIACSLPDMQPVDEFEVKIEFMLDNANSQALLINSFNTLLEPEERKRLQSLIDERSQMVPYHKRSEHEFLSDEEAPVFFEAYQEGWKPSAISPSAACLQLSSFLKRHATVTKISRVGNPYQVARMAGHNITKFDLPFLHEWYQRLDKFPPFDWFGLDTLQMALQHQVFNGVDYKDLKLQTLCRHHGIAQEQFHDALGDVRLTVALCLALQHNFVFGDPSVTPDMSRAAELARNIAGGLHEDLR